MIQPIPMNQIYYNFVRLHMGLKGTLADSAGVGMKERISGKDY